MCALSACTTTKLAARASHDPALKPAAELAANFGACVSIIDGVYGLISSAASYILELIVLTGDDVPGYHGIWSITRASYILGEDELYQVY